MTAPAADPAPSQPAFWQRVPPALFPSLFGLFGLGLAWRAAAQHFPGAAPGAVGEGVLLFTGLLYLTCAAGYIAGQKAGLAGLANQLQTIPGRAGTAALVLCIYLLAMALTPWVPILAHLLLWLALAAHLALAWIVLHVIFDQPGGLKITPVWHLNFVAFILGALAATGLGYTWLAIALFVLTFAASALIYIVSMMQFNREAYPAPQRPLLTIHLAPPCLFALVCAALGWSLLAFVFLAMAIGLAAVLVRNLSYLTVAGFTPLWGAFTFPTAALASALFQASGPVSLLALLGWLALIAASIATPLIAARVFSLWIKGKL